MASLSRSLICRAGVCLTCGDKGAVNLLIYCTKCEDAAVHHYCMDNFSPGDDNINWWCWDCAPSDGNAGKLRKSERIRTKRLKVRSTGSYWKERLNQDKRQVWNHKEMYETAQLATEDHLRIKDAETQLINEIRREHNMPEEKKSRPETPNHSGNCNESISIDEPTLARENSRNVCDVSKDRIFILHDSNKSREEHKIVDLQVPPLAVCVTSESLHTQNSLEPDQYFNAEPVIDPIWRGWFNIKEENMTGLEILAHLSDKACQKASAAVTAIPAMLEIELLDKHVVWPKSFQVSPPTAASIALYFFPARDRVERAFDSLLDEVIEKDLALKATINAVELLIFSSRELPLQCWRYRGKYYLWGVFKKTAGSRFADNGSLFSSLGTC